MATETLAVPSPAETEAPDPFNGQTPTLTEFNAYRQSGEVPEKYQPSADSAPAPEGDKPESEPDSDPDSQEPPEGIGNKARRRFEKLLAENKALKAAQQAKPDEKPAPSAAPPQQTAPIRPEPKLEDKNADGSLKYTDYTAFVKDLGAWSAEQRVHELRQQEIQQKQTAEINERVESDRERFGEDFSKIIEPTAAAINGNTSISMEVKKMLAESDVLPELLYTIGTDQKTMKELERLARVNPSQAIRYIATLEVGIREELSADPEPKDTPEPKKTAAPKPPSPVSGPSSRGFDVSDESLSTDDWRWKRNAQVARRQRS